MAESQLHAVYLVPQAVDALGEAIRPYLTEGPGGPHVLCAGIDSGGSFFEMTLEGRSAEGLPTEIELMVPAAMVRCVVTIRGGDSDFGFG